MEIIQFMIFEPKALTFVVIVLKTGKNKSQKIVIIRKGAHKLVRELRLHKLMCVSNLMFYMILKLVYA
jgi:hypothetical protein